MTGRREQDLSVCPDQIPSHEKLVGLLYGKLLTPQVAEMILRVDDPQPATAIINGIGGGIRLKAYRNETGAHLVLQLASCPLVFGGSPATRDEDVQRILCNCETVRRFSRPDETIVQEVSHSTVSVTAAWTITRERFGSFVDEGNTVPFVAKVLETIQEYQEKAMKKIALSEAIENFQA